MVGNLAVAIIGVWKLASFEIEDVHGTKSAWGKDVHGTLIYSPEGYMSVAINEPIDLKPKEPSHLSPLNQDFRAIFDSGLFYSGSFRVQGDEVLHEVTEASDPRRIAKILSRRARVQGSQLILTSPNEAFGRAVLVWNKISH